MTEAFAVLTEGHEARLPLLVHVPHGSLRVPPPWREEIALSDAALRDELLAMTDAHTETLFHQPPATAGVTFANRLSRLVFDPERFEDDQREEASRVGMGAVYRLTSAGEPLRSPDFSEASREAVLEALFRPYARALEAQVDALVRRFDRCLIVDGHSFPTNALPYEKRLHEDSAHARPDLCLGYAEPHAPMPLIEALEREADAHGLSCAHNTPFAGSYVPLVYNGRDARVSSVMIELRRGLYMNEQDGARASGFEATRAFVRALLARAVKWLEQP